MTQPRTRKALRLIAAVAVMLATAACGGDDSPSATARTTTTAAGTAGARDCGGATSITGAGSTFVQPIVQQWIKDYGQRCPDVVVSYQGVGSGAGIQQLTVRTVDFAGSDVPMKPEERSAAEPTTGSVVHLPWTAGAIAVEVNLPGVQRLQLTPEALAGIFAGRITRWDDPALVASNQAQAKLPSTAIQVVHRSDGSGTTAAFTAYLAAAAPGVWTLGSAKEIAWPAGQGAKGSDGVTALVKQTVGAIGYAEVSFARSAGLVAASIGNGGSRFAEPTASAVAAALESAAVGADGTVTIDYHPSSPEAYPISTVSYLLVPSKLAREKAATVTSFARYALDEGQDAADQLGYAPLPAALLDAATGQLDRIGR